MLIPSVGALAGSVAGFLPALAEAVVRGSIVLVIALLVTSLMCGASASARHLVWASSILVVLAIPMLGPIEPQWKTSLIPTATMPIARSVKKRASRYFITAPTPAPEAPDPASARGAIPSIGAPPAPAPRRTITITAAEAPAPSVVATAPWTATKWIALAWLIGLAAVIARLALGTLIVWRTARRSEHVDDPDWLVLGNRIARTMRISRPVTLLRSHDQTVPVTWGIIYPVVLLPASAGEWEQDRKEAVIVHELAHVARLDALTQMVVQIALAVFWFNPLVWLAARRIRAERERACDDLVLSHGTRASVYADDLLAMVRLLTRNTEPAFAALAMARRSDFEGRVLAILDPAIDRRQSGVAGVVVAAIIAAAIALPLAALRPLPKTSPVSEFRSLRLRAFNEFASSCGTSGDTHLSISSHDQESTFVFGDGKRCVVVHTAGKVTFTDDDAAVKDIATGGRITIIETSGGTERRYEAIRGSGGLEEAFYFGGKRSDPEAGAAWLRTVIPQVVRLDAKLAPARVARIRRTHGINGVLDEVDSISGDYGKRIYLETLLDAGNMTPDTVHMITRFGMRELESDYAKADFFKHLSLVSHDPETSSSIAAGAGDVSSDYYKAQLLLEALASGNETDAVDRTVIASTADLKTDYYRGSVLLRVLSRPHLSDALLSEIIGATNHFTEDYYRAAVLESLTTNQSLASRSVYTSLLHSADRITASYNHARLLETILGRADLTPDLAAAAVTDAASLTTDYDKSRVLNTVATTPVMKNAAVRDAFRATAKTITSGSGYSRMDAEMRP